MRTFSVNGAASISCSSRLNRFVACPCESNPSFDIWHNFGAGMTRPPRYKNCVACLYLWPIASMTSGEVRGAWFRVHSSMVSVFFSDTVRPAVSKTATMTVIILARPYADLDNSCIVGVQHAPNCPLVQMQAGPLLPPTVLPKVLLEVNQIP